MSDLVKQLRERFWRRGGESNDDAAIRRQKERAAGADLIEAQAAEITRLRAALATARREGMEEAAQIAASMADLVPWGTVEMGCARIADAIRAAAREGKP
jgi:hypothetical protein